MTKNAKNPREEHEQAEIGKIIDQLTRLHKDGKIGAISAVVFCKDESVPRRFVSPQAQATCAFAGAVLTDYALQSVRFNDAQIAIANQQANQMIRNAMQGAVPLKQ